VTSFFGVGKIGFSHQKRHKTLLQEVIGHQFVYRYAQLNKTFTFTTAAIPSNNVACDQGYTVTSNDNSYPTLTS
jgi:hypothetical protein